MINSLFWLNGQSCVHKILPEESIAIWESWSALVQSSYKGMHHFMTLLFVYGCFSVGLQGSRKPSVQSCQWVERDVGTWSVVPEDSAPSSPLKCTFEGSSFLVSGRTTVVIDGKQHWMLLVIWGTPTTSPSFPATRDITEKVPIISPVVGRKWALISAGDLVVIGCQHAFFHIGLLLQGLMLADYNSVASHFRFIWTYFSSLLSFHWLTSIQTHCNSSESLSSSDSSIYEKFS